MFSCDTPRFFWERVVVGKNTKHYTFLGLQTCETTPKPHRKHTQCRPTHKGPLTQDSDSLADSYASSLRWDGLPLDDVIIIKNN